VVSAEVNRSLSACRVSENNADFSTLIDERALWSREAEEAKQKSDRMKFVIERLLSVAREASCGFQRCVESLFQASEREREREKFPTWEIRRREAHPIAINRRTFNETKRPRSANASFFSRHGGASAETASGNLSLRAARAATTLSSSESTVINDPIPGSVAAIIITVGFDDIISISLPR